MQSDGRLVKLYRKGVEPAFDELVRRYRASLVAYAGAIAGRDRAEDVVQESLVKAHRSLAADAEVEPKPWLYTVVKNTALNDIRDNSKHQHAGLAEDVGRVEQPDEAFERREQLSAVVAAVADLPDSQRQALAAHELGGFSHQEIATELQLTTGATKQLIYRARLTLRNAVGAMIPFPLIAWLASDTVGVVAAGSASGAAAGGSGLLASLGGAGVAKVAVVAVVAGGSLTAGLAVERGQQIDPYAATRQEQATIFADTAGSSPGGSGVAPALILAGGGPDAEKDSRPGQEESGPESSGRGGSFGPEGSSRPEGSSGRGDDGESGDPSDDPRTERPPESGEGAKGSPGSASPAGTKGESGNGQNSRPEKGGGSSSGSGRPPSGPDGGDPPNRGGSGSSGGGRSSSSSSQSSPGESRGQSGSSRGVRGGSHSSRQD